MENDVQKSLKIGVTGHRNLSAGQTLLLEPAIKKAVENILFYAKQDVSYAPKVTFISPVATGADTLFANVALNFFDGDLMIYLPFEKEEYELDFKSAAEKTEFNRLINNQRVKEILRINRITDGNRDYLYLNTGQKVVDDCDYIIAIWDEQKAAGMGGTGDIVEYAVLHGKNILVINPTEDNPVIKANYLPHLNEYTNNIPKPDKLSENIVRDYFDVFDHVAIHNQHAYKRIWARCFRIGWLGAALILSIKVSFILTENVQFFLTVIEIVCLAYMLRLIFKEKKRAFHKNYLLYRFIAERLRINNLLYECGYYPIKTVTRVIHKAMQEIEMRYPVDLINKIIKLTVYNGETFAAKKTRVKKFVDGQAHYHEKRSERLEKELKRNHWIKMVCLGGFGLVILFHVVNELSWEGLSHLHLQDLFQQPHESPTLIDQISFFLYLFIPTTLARFEAVKYLNDWERLITQSGYMNEFFTEISGKIDRITEETELHELLIDLNDNIYLENLDWEMFMVNKNEEIT